ncbi:hypothetical protein HHI36_016100 [Cryptolaemus montrouzieri]|uniref:Uncharacterized protein n=1 Tax=Cryptolaemus montrouzieri TaxID=559131 RepID=A0ABD2NJ32_9CUCU
MRTNTNEIFFAKVELKELLTRLMQVKTLQPNNNKHSFVDIQMNVILISLLKTGMFCGVIFTHWRVKTHNVYLQSLIEVRGVKRKCKVFPSSDSQRTKPKQNCFNYNIKVDGKIVAVCKNNLMHVHGVTSSRVRRLCKLLTAGRTPKDLRGLNRGGNAISGEICSKIHRHILKYEVKQTHYGGKTKKYLNARLNVTLMHQYFLKDHPECRSIVKYIFLHKYFQENFDYCFGRPQVDVCSKCENFAAKLRDTEMSDDARRNIAAELMIHQRRAGKNM